MDLEYYLAVARSEWRVLVAAVLVGVVAAAGYAVLATRMFTATAEVLVVTTGAQTANELVQSNDFSQSQIRSYIAVASRPVVLQPVIEELDIEVTSTQLARQLSVSSPLNTTLISISATDESPEQAAAIANGVATRLASVVAEFVPKEADGTSRVRLEPIREATPPTRPSSPNVRLSLALGVFGGLVAGVVLVAVRKSLDTRVRVSADVDAVLDTALLGTVAFEPSVPERPMITSAAEQSPRAESYRQIRTSLQFLRAVNHRSVVAITSTIPGEGKTVTSANIASAMAMSGVNVCLVEADLRRPRIGAYLGLESAIGLTTVLLGEATLAEAVLPWGRTGNMDILLSGKLPPNPSEILGSDDLKHLLRTIEESYDAVVVDCAPLLPVTDGAIVANACGGAVLVIGSGKPTRTELTGAVDSLRRADAPLLGYILNLVKGHAVAQYRYSYESGTDRVAGDGRRAEVPDSEPHR